MRTSTLDAPELDRLRLVEAELRLRPLRRVVDILLIGALTVIALSDGQTSVGRASIAAVVLLLVAASFDRAVPRAIWPGGWLAVQELVGLGALCLVVAYAGGLASPALLLFAPMAALAGARRQGGPLAVSLVIAGGAIVTACALGDGPGLSSVPENAIALAAGLVAVALFASHLAHDDRASRADAVLDPLTGLLNRGALDARMTELRGQAILDGLPLSIILSDLDGLAQVNLVHGLETGDAVLTDAAAAMRATLRSFELLYRLGGDEFLLLLPGATPVAAAELAERLRLAVRDAQPGGHSVTISLGVAGAEGAGIQFGALLAEADVALYEAKGEGGDQVRLARGGEGTSQPEQIPANH